MCICVNIIIYGTIYTNKKSCGTAPLVFYYIIYHIMYYYYYNSIIYLLIIRPTKFFIRPIVYRPSRLINYTIMNITIRKMNCIVSHDSNGKCLFKFWFHYGIQSCDRTKKHCRWHDKSIDFESIHSN